MSTPTLPRQGGGELLLFSSFAGDQPVMQNSFEIWGLELGILNATRHALCPLRHLVKGQAGEGNDGTGFRSKCLVVF
jgi:hypothetical protein